MDALEVKYLANEFAVSHNRSRHSFLVEGCCRRQVIHVSVHVFEFLYIEQDTCLTKPIHAWWDCSTSSSGINVQETHNVNWCL